MPKSQFVHRKTLQTSKLKRAKYFMGKCVNKAKMSLENARKNFCRKKIDLKGLF